MSKNVSFLVIRKSDFVPWIEMYLGGTGLAEDIEIDARDKIYTEDGYVIRGTKGNLMRHKKEIKAYGGYFEDAWQFIEKNDISNFELFIRIE